MRVPDRSLVDGAVWQLRRAWPRSGEVCPLELVDPSGRAVVGRWFAAEQASRQECVRTVGARLGDDARLLLQPAGADRKLPGLAAVVGDGAELLAHRPGRRAVVRTPSGTYVKFVRGGRSAELATRHERLAHLLDGVATAPRVLAVSDDRIELTALTGRSPLDHLGTGATDWRRRWAQVGAILARLSDGGDASGLGRHDAAAEADVTRTWVARAVAAGRLPAADLDPHLTPLLDAAPEPTGLAHRDLHDGQLLFDADGVGLLDPDTLAVAEPALDLANLLVHLELRVEQGLLSPTAHAQATDELLHGADPSEATRRRLAAHLAACRLRIAAVYSFRPRWQPLARRWYVAATSPSAGSAVPPCDARGAGFLL